VFANVTLIEPVLVKQKRLIDAATRDQSQLRSVRDQIEAVLKDQHGGPKDPEQAALLDLEGRVARAEKELARRKGAFVAPTRLPVLVKDLLGPGRAVRFEALRACPIPRRSRKAARAAALGTGRASGREVPRNSPHGASPDA
jgi:hypothetical protein